MNRHELMRGAALLVATTACALGATACGAAAQGSEGDPTTGPEASEPVGSASAALSDADICNIIDAGTKDIAQGISPNLQTKVACQNDAAKSVSYLGGSGIPTFTTSSSRLEAEALYCPLQATDGENAIPQFDTPFGKMGMQSRIAISKADPASLHVTGQRVGTLVAFGNYLDLE